MAKKRRKRTPIPTPIPRFESRLVEAVEIMGKVSWLEDTPYLSPYRRIADAFLDIQAKSWRARDGAQPVRELDWFPTDVAMRWLDRIRERNFLASVMATDALERLSRYVLSRWERRAYDFLGPRDKADLTRNQGEYWIEFEVPEGTSYELRNKTFEPGHRGVALVERCHLSSNFYHASWGKATIRGFGECHSLLGFDVPCRVTNLCSFEGDQMVTGRYNVGGGIVVGGDWLVSTHGTTCEIPFGFILGSRQRNWENHQESYPFSPKLSFDEMVKLIEEVAKEPDKEPEPSVE